MVDDFESFKESLSFLNDYSGCVKKATDLIGSMTYGNPQFALVLGSGLGPLAKEIDVKANIPYEFIPHWPVSTVKGHRGRLLTGTLEGVPIVAMQGRKHFYELGTSPTWQKNLSFPVNVFAELGIPNLFVTNAAGGLNLDFEQGDIMIIKDHINMIPNPLCGLPQNFKTVSGEDVQRFPNMQNAYDPDLIELLSHSSHDPLKTHTGVYLALTGPTFETTAESRLYRSWGADAVGMSTAPEVIVARWRGMRCVGMSCITNTIPSSGANDATHDEVVSTTEDPEVYTNLSETIKNFIRNYR